MNLLIDVLRVCGFFGVVVFMASYHILAPWWRSEIGRNLMTWAGSTALFLLLGVLQTMFGPGYPGQTAARVLAFAGIGWAAWWRWVLLVKAQRDGRTQEHLPPAPTTME